MNTTKIIVIPEGKISDYIDGKFRNDTPEEYVRQTIEKRLINEHKYSSKIVKIEYALQLGSKKPRADIVIFDKGCTDFTQNNVKIIIECKRKRLMRETQKTVLRNLNPICRFAPTVNGVCGQTESKKKFSENTSMKTAICVLWIIMTYRQPTVILMT